MPAGEARSREILAAGLAKYLGEQENARLSLPFEGLGAHQPCSPHLLARTWLGAQETSALPPI